MQAAARVSDTPTTLTVQAEQRTVTIDDIVAVHGPRPPDSPDIISFYEASGGRARLRTALRPAR